MRYCSAESRDASPTAAYASAALNRKQRLLRMTSIPPQPTRVLDRWAASIRRSATAGAPPAEACLPPGAAVRRGPVECHDEHRRSCNGSLQEDAAEACGVSLGRKAVEDDELELERRGRASRIEDSPIYDRKCLERPRSVSKVDLRTAQEVK